MANSVRIVVDYDQEFISELGRENDILEYHSLGDRSPRSRERHPLTIMNLFLDVSDSVRYEFSRTHDSEVTENVFSHGSARVYRSTDPARLWKVELYNPDEYAENVGSITSATSLHGLNKTRLHIILSEEYGNAVIDQYINFLQARQKIRKDMPEAAKDIKGISDLDKACKKYREALESDDLFLDNVLEDL